MKKLKDLYQERETFIEYGMPTPPPLQEAIEIAELKEITLKLAEDSAIHTLPQGSASGKIRISYEYNNGTLATVSVERTTEILNRYSQSKHFTSEDAISPRQPSIGFSVNFLSSGKIVKTIREATAQNTMIEALRYIGLEKASKYDGENFSGYRLVGKIQRITDGNENWQRFVDGWWIYTNLSNERKIKCLNGVAKMLNIQINIISDSPKATTPSLFSQTKNQNRLLFSLNGNETAVKNRSVLNSIRLFIKEKPSVSFKGIRQMFSTDLQGSYGVVATIQEIEDRAKHNMTERKRWFLSSSDILTSADGVRFAVCNQWGPENFIRFQKHISALFGWTLKEQL